MRWAIAWCLLVCACGEDSGQRAAFVAPGQGDAGEQVDERDGGGLAVADGGAQEADAGHDAATGQDTSTPGATDGGLSRDAARAPTYATSVEVLDAVVELGCASCHGASGNNDHEPFMGRLSRGDTLPDGAIGACGLPYADPGHPEHSSMWVVFQQDASPCQPHRVLEREPSQHQLDQIEDWIRAGAGR